MAKDLHSFKLEYEEIKSGLDLIELTRKFKRKVTNGRNKSRISKSKTNNDK